MGWPCGAVLWWFLREIRDKQRWARLVHGWVRVAHGSLFLDPTRPDETLTRLDPRIHPTRGQLWDGWPWPWFVAQWCVLLQPKNRYRMIPGVRHSCIVNLVHWIELQHLWYFSLSQFPLPSPHWSRWAHFTPYLLSHWAHFPYPSIR